MCSTYTNTTPSVYFKYIYVKRTQNAWMRALYVKINKPILLYAHRRVGVCVNIHLNKIYKERNKHTQTTREAHTKTLLHTLLLFCWIKWWEAFFCVSIFNSMFRWVSFRTDRCAWFCSRCCVYLHIYFIPNNKITEQPYTHPAIELKVPIINTRSTIVELCYTESAQRLINKCHYK